MSHGTLRKYRTGKSGKERRAAQRDKRDKKTYDRSKSKRRVREAKRYWA